MMKKISCWIVLVLLLSKGDVVGQEWQSEIVFEGSEGQLEYAADDEGNRIPDFSHAGYRGGGVSLPTYPVVMSIQPIEGDNTAHIQQALDQLAAADPDENGVRGALLLEAGIYEVTDQLRLRVSGIVLRGAGKGDDPSSNTIIKRRGASTESVIKIGSGRNENAWLEIAGTRTNITSDFVQVGSRSFTVANAALYNIGDQIIILHPLSQAWIDAVDGGGTSSDPPWETDEFDIAYTRRIQSIQDGRITVDAPVFNHLDRSLTQSYIYKRDNNGEIEEVGIENLRVEIETNGPLTEDHARSAIEFVHVANAWITDVTTMHFVYAGIDVRKSIHVTVRDSEALEPHSLIEGARRYNFAVFESQLVLFENNLASEGRHNYVGNGEGWDSGIVFLKNTSLNALNTSEPHRHWGQGFLFDNHEEIGSDPGTLRMRLANRGSFGTGHGWSAVHSVAWNCKMNGTTVSVQKPPTAQNYAIGCEGRIFGTGSFSQPAGYIEGANRLGISPASLYERQLADRLSLPPTEPTGDGPRLDAQHLTVSNFPNPFAESTTLQVYLKSEGTLEIDIFDVLGREVKQVTKSALPVGVYNFFVNGDLTDGMYMARLTFSGEDGKDIVHYKIVKRAE